MKLLKTGQKESGLRVHPDEKTTRLYIGLALFAATLALYWPVRHFDYISLDDPLYISTNWLMQQGWTMKGLAWSFLEQHFGYWHPLVWVSYMTECQLFGPGPAAHHVVNAIFHAANAALLFWLLQQLTGATWRSAFAAALFAFHPLRVESVAWITERKDMLSGFFFMLTLLAYAQYARRKPASVRHLFLALGFYALGLMSKPMIVTTPFVLLLLDFWPLQRCGEKPLAALPRLIREKWAFFLLTLLFSAVTFSTQNHDRSVVAMALADRLQNAVVVYPIYLEKFLWPHDLTLLYLRPTGWPGVEVLAAFILVAGFSMVAIFQFRARPWLTAGWFWFLGMLFPVCGIIQSGNQFMADRFTYLASIGLVTALTWVVAAGLPASFRHRTLMLCVGAALVLGGAWGATRRQLAFWQNSKTVWTHALQLDPANFIAHNGLGVVLLEQKQNLAAAAEFNLTVKLRPDFAEAWNNLGLIAMRENNYGQAADDFQRGLNADPQNTLALANLGNALRMAHDYADAEPLLKKALQFDPEFLPAHDALASLYDDLGKFDLAIPHYEKFLQYRPGAAPSQCNLAIDLMAVGRIPEAMPHFEIALKLSPQNPAFHYYHGTAFLAAGHLVEGVVELREALRLEPKYLAALDDLAWILATNPNEAVRNGKEAVQLAESACALTGGRDARALRSLDAAYAEAGRFPEAIAAAEKARALFLTMHATNLVTRTEARLQLYRANRPFRD